MVLNAVNVRLWVETLSLTAQRAPQFIDITDQVAACLQRSGIASGMVVVYSKHTTAAIKINEHEPELLKDMEAFLSRLSPADSKYFHNDFSVRTVNMEEDECPNGHAHCQALLLGPSACLNVIDGKLLLGRWQHVFMAELDGPRAREISVLILGEGGR